MKKLFTLFLFVLTYLVSNAQDCNPATITKVEHEGSGNRITWTMPTGGEVVTISQQNGNLYDCFGVPEDIGAFHRFTPEDLAVINGGALTQLVFIPAYFKEFQTEPGHTYIVQIYKGGKWGTVDERNPGILISSQELNNNNLLFHKENTINLETPVTVDASKELWIGFFCTNIAAVQSQFKGIVGVDAGPCTEGLGNLFFYQNQWRTIFEVGGSSWKNNNWCIKGKVQTVEGVSVNIYFNNDKIESNITGTTFLHSNPTGEEHCYKVEVNCLKGGVSPLSNEICITETECYPATHLEVKYASDCSSANLTWVAPQNMLGTILYNVYRNDTLLISNHSTTSYKTTNFNPNIVNIWSVKVVCPTGESDAVSVTKQNCVVGVHENKTVRFNIYPNPAGNELRITNYELRINNIEIIDIFGRKVYEHNNSYGLTLLRSYGLTTDEVVINVSYLSAGVYFVKLIDEQGFSVQRFIKE